MKNKRNLTVLIIDEHSETSSLLAERLRLSPGIRLVGATANVMLGAELAHELKPDVILADFRRTGPPRAETYRWLSRVSPASKLIAHTSYLPNGDECALREAGVARCILKGDSVARLAQQILETAIANPRQTPAAERRTAMLRRWLKPCPHCRGNHLLESRADDRRAVRCMQCGYLLLPDEMRVLTADGVPAQQTEQAAA